MRRPPLVGGFWPDDDQELLVRAAVAPREPALAAWRRLRPRLDIDSMGFEEVRILPAVLRNLEPIDDPETPRMRGLSRRAWYTGQIQTDALRQILAILGGLEIPTLVLKGPALIARFHGGNASVRPMGDLDVLVPPERAREALESLRAAGWELDPGAARLDPGRLFRRHHAASLARDAVRVCDLHWRIGMELVDPAAPGRSSAAFWEGSREQAFGGVTSRILCDTDQLLHVIVHGARAWSGARLHWIVDAAAVLRGGELDAERLVALAQRSGTIVPLRDGIRYLRRVGVEVPPVLAGALAAARPPPRAALAAHLGGLESRLLGDAPRTLGQFLRLTHGLGLAGTVAALPRYLVDAWDLERPSRIPGYVIRKAVRRP